MTARFKEKKGEGWEGWEGGLETEYIKRELHVLYCFSVDISDKIWSICYTQNFHLAHEKKVMQILLFNYFFPLSNNLFTLQKHEREVGLYFHQKFLNPSKFLTWDTKRHRCHFIFFSKCALVKYLLTFYGKKAFWEHGEFIFHSFSAYVFAFRS